jgi:hypothetical protein
MSTTTATTTAPTAPRYQCGSGCGAITFNWGRQMPDNGRLGEVTFGQYVNKPIQVFDLHIIRDSEGNERYRDWAFQAQDGSFLGRMYVSSPRQSFIGFAKFRAGDQWPQVICSVPYPDPLDSRDAIEKAV